MSNYINMFKKKIFNIKNFNYVMILSLITTSIILALTFIYFSVDYTKSITDSVINREIIILSDVDEDLLKENDHIIFYGSDVYNLEPFYEVDKINNVKSGITIKPLIDEKTINIIDGKNISEEGQIICSKNFYPYYLTKYGDKKLIDSKDLINNTIKIDNNYYTVVGTFQNIPFDTADTCYIGKDDYLKLDLTNSGDMLILIDDISNYNQVVDFLNNNNLEYIKVLDTDNMTLYVFFYIPMFIMLIIIVIMIDVIYYFEKKKIIKNLKFYGILKSCGYSNRRIIKYNIIENSVLLIFIVPISLLIYGLGIWIIKQYFMYDYIYNNLYIRFPILYFVLFIINFIIITNAIIVFLTKKYMNLEINTLIGEDN